MGLPPRCIGSSENAQRAQRSMVSRAAAFRLRPRARLRDTSTRLSAGAISSAVGSVLIRALVPPAMHAAC